MQKLFACLIAVLHLTSANYSQQPVYQTSIMLNMPGSVGSPVHLCNGVIISEKMILTTADCVHFKFGPNAKPNKLDASALSVFAGSTNAQTDALQANVSAIEVSQNYNPLTLENDLAILTISQSLPLGTRPDIKWIMIDDNTHVNRSCLVNFFSRNPKDAIPNYYQTEELHMVNNQICRNETKYPVTRKKDLCSFYVLPHKFSCAAAEVYLSFNNDRGTGLVCKSYLVGLLSSVVTRPDPAKNCTDVTLKAMYTNIYPHLRWIYTRMAGMETEYISTPYDASLNPLVSNSSSNGTSSENTPTNSTIAPNSTLLTSSTGNSTILHPLLLNSTITNSTSTNSTNSTIFNSATPFFISSNSSTWNTTTLYVTNSSINHTIHRPLVNNTIPRPAPTTLYGSPTHTKPVIQNFLKNNAALVRFTPGSILILLISHRLIAVCL